MDNAVTIIVTPRDRYLFTQDNLESIYKNSDLPFHLVYVDAGSPPNIQEYLQQMAKEKNFQLVRVDRYLTPNQSRNIGRQYATTPLVVFLENDVVVAPSWLSALVDCAKQTGCDVVCPLTCQDFPVHENIHYSGGEMEIKEEMRQGKTERFISEKMFHKQGSKHFDIKPPLARGKVGFTEVHAFLVRLDMLQKIKGFDEGVMSTRDHVDFSLNVRQAGGTIYFEPKSVITFMGHFASADLEPWEEEFFKLRWSDAWEYNSLMHISKKWKLTDDKNLKTRIAKMGWRRRLKIIKPKIKHIRPRVLRRGIEEVMVFFDRMENHKMTDAFARQYADRPGS